MRLNSERRAAQQSYVDINNASEVERESERKRLNSKRCAAQQSYVEIYNASEVERESERD